MVKEDKKIEVILNQIDNKILRRKIEIFLKEEVYKYLKDLEDLDYTLISGNLNFDVSSRLRDLNDDIIRRAEFLTSSIEHSNILKQLRVAFREKVGEWFYKSPFFKVSLMKPRGYPGDFEMMDIIYNYVLASEDLIGKYFDKYYLDSPYAQAVRNRKNRMVEVLTKLMCEEHKEYNIFDIACGPSRDLKELFDKQLSLKSKIKITCFDHDQAALDFSKRALKAVPQTVQVDYLKGDILSYVRNAKKVKRSAGGHDLVYSLGLADYMPDNLFKGMVLFAFSLLNKGGQFILAHKIEENDPAAPYTPKWICEWVFNSRNEADLIDLIKNSGIDNFSFKEPIWDATHRVMFITIAKH